ncbi:Protein tweety 1 [Ataeniobius toweri]|uniref:Protein tweety homolog n=1 Tax=Ataeniobius toweri TaxID=208326 RepID=A0ABU7BTH0_9TELE|nr:Protein tweety 1 [Ataeniobius toweri]
MKLVNLVVVLKFDSVPVKQVLSIMLPLPGLTSFRFQSLTLTFPKLLTQSQRALSNIHTHLSSLDRNALPQFPKAEKSLREVQQILNSTEGNFHQLVALLNCRGLNKDYIDSLKGLCYDGMEGLLYLSLYSFLSGLAFTAILCSLPGAWRSFPR